MFMAKEVRLVAVNELLPYARNSRTHSDAQVAAVAASIREFGFTNPILMSGDGTIVAGHGRVMAARKLGLTEVPCIDVGHMSSAQMRAYVIADNRLAEQAGWDEDLLKVEMLDLSAAGFDLNLIGFSQDEIDAMLAAPGTEGNTDPDEIPEPPANPVSQPGDLWVLGRHRIICGDSTNKADVEKLLAGVKPHLMVTDPPYGVEYDPSWRAKAGVNLNEGKLGKVLNDDRADWREAWALFPGDVAYVWHASLFTREVIDSLEACGFEHRAMIIWAKDRFTLGRGHYHWQHEPAWYVVRKGANGHWVGDRNKSTLWNIPAREDGGHGHGTQKPVECMRRPIENNSSPGQAIYEPFSGSGTTIIAAEQTGRACYAVELSPAYVDVAVKRWQDFAGGGAVLEGDGRTFADIAASRA
jgi:DNA modification methylase